MKNPLCPLHEKAWFGFDQHPYIIRLAQMIADRDRKPMRIYFDDKCGGLHLTSTEKLTRGYSERFFPTTTNEYQWKQSPRY